MDIEKIQTVLLYKICIINCIYFWLTPLIFKADISSDKVKLNRGLTLESVYTGVMIPCLMCLHARVCVCVCVRVCMLERLCAYVLITTLPILYNQYLM